MLDNMFVTSCVVSKVVHMVIVPFLIVAERRAATIST